MVYPPSLVIGCAPVPCTIPEIGIPSPAAVGAVLATPPDGPVYACSRIVVVGGGIIILEGDPCLAAGAGWYPSIPDPAGGYVVPALYGSSWPPPIVGGAWAPNVVAGLSM